MVRVSWIPVSVIFFLNSIYQSFCRAGKVCHQQPIMEDKGIVKEYRVISSNFGNSIYTTFHAGFRESQHVSILQGIKVLDSRGFSQITVQVVLDIPNSSG